MGQAIRAKCIKDTSNNCLNHGVYALLTGLFGAGNVAMAQMGFCDHSDRYASLDARMNPLVEIKAVVPWEKFRPTLEGVWRKPDAESKSRAGRKLIDAIVMFKALVLNALYNLSDDQIEYQVRDRLSFMRFLGLGVGNRVPDAKTVWLYREALAQASMVEALFKQFDGHVRDHGIAGPDWASNCRMLGADLPGMLGGNEVEVHQIDTPKQSRYDVKMPRTACDLCAP